MYKELPVQRVLIAIDMTDAGRAAFYTGLHLARRLDAESWVLYVSEPLRAFDFAKRRYVDTMDTIERVEEGVRRRIEELWTEGGLEVVDRRKVHIVVRGGRAHQEIVDTAAAKDADLIVMGAGGSTMERVVRNASCSVFCVRPKA